MGGGFGGNGSRGEGIRSTNKCLQNSHMDVKYSTGNGEAKELIHMTPGQEQWCGDCLREWGVLGGGAQRWKNWDNCSSIINKR